MKFCVDCEHFERAHYVNRCGASLSPPDPVTGYQIATPCAGARAAWRECGPNAKLFKPKPAPPPPPPDKYVIAPDCAGSTYEDEKKGRTIYVAAKTQPPTFKVSYLVGAVVGGLSGAAVLWYFFG